MDPHLLSHGPSAHAPVVLPARLTFSDLTDGQVAHAFDFLPLVQHAWKQMEHAGGMASAGEDAKAVHMATGALVQKFALARDLLSLLPNIDVSQSEQLAEAAKLDEIIARKRKLIDAYRIAQAQRQMQQTNTTAGAEEKSNDDHPMSG